MPKTAEEEELDVILARQEDALAQLDLAQGSLVKRPRVELELLEQLEAARDLMISVLHSKERTLLVRIFGGDCVRVSRVRAVLESVRFSSMEDRLLRLRSCLDACEMVEEVLGDLGLGFALRLAQARQKELLTERRLHERRLVELGALGKVPELVPGAELQGPPEVLGAPEAPATLEVPAVPEALGVPEAPEAPAALGLPEALEASEAPTAPTAPDTPTAPEVSAELEAPESSEGTEALETPAAPEALEAPEAPEVLAVPEVPGAAEAPQAPAPPEAPEEREVPEGSETTEVPAAPEPLDLPEAPDVPEAPESPEAPEAPKSPAAPEAPEAPDAQEAPEVSEAPAAPAAQVAPEAPEVPQAPEVPEAPEALEVEVPALEMEELRPVDRRLDAEESEEGLAEEKSVGEQLPEEAGATSAELARAKPAEMNVERTPSFEQAAAALRDIAAPAIDLAAAGGRRHTAGAGRRRQEPAETGRRRHSASAWPGMEPEAEPVVREPGECSDPPETEKSASESSQGREEEEEAEASSYLLELPPWLDQLLQRLFAFYASTDGTSAGAGLGLTRFRSFLRDAGLLRAADASAAMQSLSQASGESSCGPPSARRRSSISRGGRQLPLQLLPEPPLTLVQADIMHVTARERQPVVRSYMTLDAFCWSVADIAIYCRQRGLLECGGTPDEIVVAFCEKLMVPLGEFLGLGEQELRLAVALREEAAPLFQQARVGLCAAFAQRARGLGGADPYRRGHWTLQALRRFAADLDLVAEMSHSALQRVFDTCAQHEVNEERGQDGMLSFQGFKLAFIMIAQRVHNAPDCTSMERLALLLLRLGAVQGASDIGAAARSILGTPGRGARNSGRQRQPRRVSRGF